jgi:uncharacterized membrane protein
LNGLVSVAEFVNLVAAGLLAGGEFIVCYGVRVPLGRLEAAPQIRLRQNLIRRLRVLVPLLFAVAFLAGAGTVALGGSPLVQTSRGLGLAALAVFMAVTLGGTVPINKAALEWRAAEPPIDWERSVDRWERLNVVRAWAAVAALCAFQLAALQGR